MDSNLRRNGVKHNAIGGSRAAAILAERSVLKNSPVHRTHRPTTEAWTGLLSLLASLFTALTFSILGELLTAYVLCPVRRTVTGMMRGGGLVDKRPRDAYHRLGRAAR
jgi:hypothetical protein